MLEPPSSCSSGQALSSSHPFLTGGRAKFCSFLHTPLNVQKLDKPDFVDGTRQRICSDSAHFEDALYDKSRQAWCKLRRDAIGFCAGAV